MSKYSSGEPMVSKDSAGITTISFKIHGEDEVVQISIPPSAHTRLFDKLRVTMPGYDDPESGEIIPFDQAS